MPTAYFFGDLGSAESCVPDGARLHNPIPHTLYGQRTSARPPQRLANLIPFPYPPSYSLGDPRCCEPQRQTLICGSCPRSSPKLFLLSSRALFEADCHYTLIPSTCLLNPHIPTSQSQTSTYGRSSSKERIGNSQMRKVFTSNSSRVWQSC